MQAVRYDVEAFAARRQVHIAETLVNADEPAASRRISSTFWIGLPR